MKKIIVEFIGGLGNQMFQYAYLLQLKSQYKTVFADLRAFDNYDRHNGFELENIFTIELPKCSGDDCLPLLEESVSIQREELFSTIFQISDCESDTLFLKGYWQSERYFSNCLFDVRQFFIFNKKIISEKNIFLAQKMETENSVSIHVRRGDYLSNPESRVAHGDICNESYYHNAIAEIEKRVAGKKTYYIFSDDPDFALTLFEGMDVEVVDWNRGTNSWQDMYLMSQCKHNIVANSSFSWWGAWLNSNKEKIVIAPNRWFNTIDAPFLIPENWIQIKIEEVRISVIIPVYNVEKYLENCLRSVVNQTYRSIEIIVVNDGSTDGSLSILEQFAAIDSRIQIINKENGGVVSARNAGLTVAKGEYIHYLDGDDYLELDAYELLIREVNDKKPDMLLFPFWYGLDSGEVPSENKYNKEMSNWYFLKKILRENGYFAVWHYLHKRTLYSDNEIAFDNSLTMGEDAFLTCQLAYYSSKIVYLDNSKPLLHYVFRKESTCNNVLSLKSVDSYFSFPNRIVDFFLRKDILNDYCRELQILKLIILVDDLLVRNHGRDIKRIADEVVPICNRDKSFWKVRQVSIFRKLLIMYHVSEFLGQLYLKYYHRKGKFLNFKAVS